MQGPAIDEEARADTGPHRHVGQRAGALPRAQARFRQRRRADIDLQRHPPPEAGPQGRHQVCAAPARLGRRQHAGPIPASPGPVQWDRNWRRRRRRPAESAFSRREESQHRGERCCGGGGRDAHFASTAAARGRRHS